MDKIIRSQIRDTPGPLEDVMPGEKVNSATQNPGLGQVFISQDLVLGINLIPAMAYVLMRVRKLRAIIATSRERNGNLRACDGERDRTGHVQLIDKIMTAEAGAQSRQSATHPTSSLRPTPP